MFVIYYSQFAFYRHIFIGFFCAVIYVLLMLKLNVPPIRMHRYINNLHTFEIAFRAVEQIG